MLAEEPQDHPELRGIAERRTTSKRSWPGVPTTATLPPSGACHSPISRPTVVVALRWRPGRVRATELITSVEVTALSEMVQTAVVFPTPNGPTKAT
ncbi:MAG: hypothetical protein R2731_09185 [Nocardioides sp.]